MVSRKTELLRGLDQCNRIADMDFSADTDDSDLIEEVGSPNLSPREQKILRNPMEAVCYYCGQLLRTLKGTKFLSALSKPVGNPEVRG